MIPFTFLVKNNILIQELQKRSFLFQQDFASLTYDPQNTIENKIYDIILKSIHNPNNIDVILDVYYPSIHPDQLIMIQAV